MTESNRNHHCNRSSDPVHNAASNDLNTVILSYAWEENDPIRPYVLELFSNGIRTVGQFISGQAEGTLPIAPGENWIKYALLEKLERDGYPTTL